MYRLCLFSLVVAVVSAGTSLSVAMGETRAIAGETRAIVGETRNLAYRTLDLTALVIEMVRTTETAKEIRVELPADILFDFDKATIREAARPAIAQAAAVIRGHLGARVRIEGHTDAKGADSYNLPLSQRRAEAVRVWLAEKEALRLANIPIQGFAARRPVVPNTRPDGSDDPEGRQRNRRVEIIITK